VRREALCMHHCVFCFCYKNAVSDFSYEWTSNRVNVFGSGVMLPGPLEVSLAVTTPCHLLLSMLSGSTASKISGH
jgi:hypothetical protein